MAIINNPTQAQMVKAVRDLEDGKINTVTGATSGNFASFDANGNLADSGKKASDFLTHHQDISDLAKIDASNITNTSAWKTALGYLTSVPDASTSAKGIIEIATDAEATAGTATNLAITPKQLKAGLNSISIPNVSNFITKDVNNLTNYTLSTGVGAKIELSINSSTYVLTATLKNADGDTLGTPQTVDLPLETMVVGASYNSNTKEITLTLQNSTTTSFSVADLVSGLVPTTRKVAGKALSADITLASTDLTDSSSLARTQDIPTNTNQLTNGAGFITSSAIIGKVDKIASTDNAIARFDGTGGAIQNSKVTIDDDGVIYSNNTKVALTSDLTNVVKTTTNNTFTANNIFKNNAFEIRANSASDDSWIKLTNATDSGYYAFGIRRPYDMYGLQMKIHQDDGSDQYIDILHAGNYNKYVVPTSRTVNGKALSGNISLTASDVGALPSSTEIPKIYYGTSTTNASTAEKVVSCADFLSLEAGAIITVRFSYANGKPSPALNVNGTGAKPIRYRNSNDNTVIFWQAYDSLTFRYNGTYWDIIGNLDTNTKYTLSSFGITATSTELNYCDGVTSNIQTQLNAKAESSAIPTTTSQLTNDSGFITTSSLGNYLPLSGGTLTGSLTVTNSAATSSVTISEGNITASGTITCTACIVEDVEFYTTEPGLPVGSY